ncbi:unnamed protein product [Cylindrotheca closterium]|uniref:25S rRNA (uridine-N(3))-methyltransferase BMT5-like domain-containing protein n=1 Tax=Cylindrotheca closterium TaxID=2856 RepID=A0AAD2JPE4_9STRA|nr:unnamed protein product [Cylindrotheca closterium]
MLVPRFHTFAGIFACSISPGRALVSTQRRLFSSTALKSHFDVPTENTQKKSSNLDHGSTTLLVCGDGDLSYSAGIAEKLAKSNINMVATVLEEENIHQTVYKRSLENSESICKHEGHELRFGIDATKLEEFFPTTRFDFIEFNFPHWRGKTNHRHNRQLLSDFLQSASHVVKPDGEIRVALCDAQGGMPAASIEEWKRSWMAAMYAGSHGLLLKKLEPYAPDYELSSHRGVDRPFWLGDSPQQYTFSLPDGDVIDEELQISCRHELRISLDDKLEQCPVSYEEIVVGDAVEKLVQPFIPDGIDFQIAARELLTSDNKLKAGDPPLAVFLLNYSGASMPLSRQDADEIRKNIEATVANEWKLDIAKKGRMVSKPYPSVLLPSLIRDIAVIC